MAADLPRLSHKDSPSELCRALDECGGVIVEGLIEPELVDRINAELDPHAARANPGMTHLNPAVQFFFGDKTRHVSGVAGKSRAVASELMCHPTLLAVCDEILLPACARYQLNLAHVIERGPGSVAQLLHRDELVWVHVPSPHPELQVATMVALSDFTKELGATRIVPGSHRWPKDRQAEEHEVADAVMPSGSAVLYLGSTIHGAGTNSHAQKARRGMHLSYVVGWLRTEENNVLAVPPEIARDLPRTAQELLGYAVHDAIADAGGYLGMVGLEDPIELLRRGEL